MVVCKNDTNQSNYSNHLLFLRFVWNPNAFCHWTQLFMCFTLNFETDLCLHSKTECHLKQAVILGVFQYHVLISIVITCSPG